MSRAWTPVRLAAPVTALLLAGCAVGPDYHQPALPTGAGYTKTPLPAATSAPPGPTGGAQGFAVGRDIPHEWWTVFHSADLSRLVAASLEANPDIEAAAANLQQAQHLVEAARGPLFPSLSGELNTTRQAFSGASVGLPTYNATFTLHTPTLNFSYDPDLFGGTRRQIESQEAQAEYQRFQLEAARLTVSSNVVVTAIQEASLRAQLAATEKIIAINRRQLDLARERLALGATTKSDVLAQQTSLAQTEATLPGLRQQLQQQRDRLAVLAGRFPSQGIDERFSLDALQLPDTLPVSLPSHLVDQRPDILAAAATLHQATAQVGIATAALLPQISLTGQYGRMAPTVPDIFTPGTLIWSIGYALTQPLFNGGQLIAQRRAAVAGAKAALATYRGTVMRAFQDVGDALNALQADSDRLAAQDAAARSAAESLRLAETQYGAGALSFLGLLNAQAADQQAQIALIQARATRLADTAGLFQALGGGWWNQPAATREN
jgi:NodT family efflux transporter outer membrane factor (OMF) lipoprotein